jgi:hypothetical protein
LKDTTAKVLEETRVSLHNRIGPVKAPKDFVGLEPKNLVRLDLALEVMVGLEPEPEVVVELELELEVMVMVGLELELGLLLGMDVWSLPGICQER